MAADVAAPRVGPQVRAEALVALGLSEKAIKLLREALSRDPDNEACATQLKRLKRLVAETARVQEGVTRAMGARRFEHACALCAEGLKLDSHDKGFKAKLYADRAKAFQMIARSRSRGETRAQREAAAAKAAGGGGEGDEGVGAASKLAADEAAPPEDADDPRAGAKACWRRCLQDASNALYTDGASLSGALLKAEALQALERWGEAVGALEACINAEPSRAQDQSIVNKLAEAQFLVKKSQREDLYGLFGVGTKASEKEIRQVTLALTLTQTRTLTRTRTLNLTLTLTFTLIRQGYKRLALEWHPDKHSHKDEAGKKVAEAKFKSLGDALDILTDPFKRGLWDEGHDLDSIAQRVQMRDQQQAQQGRR